MSQSLASDSRGVIQPCPACGTGNRIAYARLDQRGNCGECKAVLPAISLPVEITDSAAFDVMAAHSPLPIVLDFWAPWCGPCRMMAPEFAKAAAEAAGQMLFVKINSDDHPSLSGRYGVNGIPAFVLLHHGQVTAQTAGFQPAARLLAWIRQAS